MIRTPLPDKKTGFISQVIRTQSPEETNEWEKSILRNPPPGIVNSVRWISHNEFVIVPIPDPAIAVAVAPPAENPKADAAAAESSGPVDLDGPGDGLDELKDVQLKTRMGRASLPYTAQTSRESMIKQLRAKSRQQAQEAAAIVAKQSEQTAGAGAT